MSEIENKCMHNYYRVCCERVHYTVVVLVYIHCSLLIFGWLERQQITSRIYTEREIHSHTLSLQKVPCMAHLV